MEEKTKTPVRMRTLELLAPAKNLECGKAAIDHGADAVYIGAPRFGARAAAGNSIEDIKELCEYAHQFGARVHVTVNTIVVSEDEMEETLKMISELEQIHVDALLLQDMGVLWEVRARSLFSGELHASTQCDTRTAEKAFWLSTVGFTRVVLARELSVDEIRKIHETIPDLQLEVFVHGALCVSYSGVCYASEKCFHRSANRGECAQFCRMKFNLLDSNDQEIEHQRHLLSLKDLCQIDHLEELASAGACSFKIEGRLKDVNYVKNVVAAYNKKLNQLVAKYPTSYRRASRGLVEYNFMPNLKKTFNRGFTNYFLNGRQPDIASFDTPKAMGEYVGKVKEIRGNISFNVSSVASFANGDGLCFINDDRELEGFRVNRVEGNRLYPHHMPENLRPGMSLYRNNDQAFENILARTTASRKIPLFIWLSAITKDNPMPDGSTGIHVQAFMLTEEATGMGIKVAEFDREMTLEPARRPQTENIVMQMHRMGDTIYECKEVRLLNYLGNYFIPNSMLATLRREIIEEVEKTFAGMINPGDSVGSLRNLFGGGGHYFSEVGEHKLQPEEFVWQPEYGKWGYLYNIANDFAKDFYVHHGLAKAMPAFELGNHTADENQNSKSGESLIMQCRHCIRYSLGYCVKRGGKKPTWKEPLYLELGDGRRFRLEFACKECQMNVYSTE